MSFIATVIATTAISGGLSYLGAKDQAKASQQAADAQAGASDRATQAQLDMFYQNRADMAPYRDIGTQGLYRLSDLMGIQPYVPVTGSGAVPPPGASTATSYNNLRPTLTMTQTPGAQGPNGEPTYQYLPKSENFGMLTRPFTYNDLYQDPGYAFRLAQGNQAIDRASAARGNFFSGGTGKALTQYNSDMASQEFNNAYNRYNQDQNTLYNRFAGLSGTGQNATSQIGQYGQNTANQIGQNALYAGNAAAQGYLGAGAARASGYAGVGNAVNSGISNYLFMNALNKPINVPYNPNGLPGGAWARGY